MSGTTTPPHFHAANLASFTEEVSFYGWMGIRAWFGSLEISTEQADKMFEEVLTRRYEDRKVSWSNNRGIFSSPNQGIDRSWYNERNEELQQGNANAISALEVSRRVTRTIPPPPQGVREDPAKARERSRHNQEVRASQAKALREWATTMGLMLDSCEFQERWEQYSRQLGYESSGQEHDVYFNGRVWVKRNRIDVFHTGYDEFFERIKLHNNLFPEAPVIFKGFVDYDNFLWPVVEQIGVTAERGAQPDEVAVMMREKGFRPVNTDKTDYINDNGVRVEDLHNENALMSNGKVVVIDPVIFAPRIEVYNAPSAATFERKIRRGLSKLYGYENPAAILNRAKIGWSEVASRAADVLESVASRLSEKGINLSGLFANDELQKLFLNPSDKLEAVERLASEHKVELSEKGYNDITDNTQKRVHAFQTYEIVMDVRRSICPNIDPLFGEGKECYAGSGSLTMACGWD